MAKYHQDFWKWKHLPGGWELMNYEKRGKMVCRYFYPGGSDGR